MAPRRDLWLTEARGGKSGQNFQRSFPNTLRYNKHSIHSITTWSYLTQYMLMVTWHQGRVIAAVQRPISGRRVSPESKTALSRCWCGMHTTLPASAG